VINGVPSFAIAIDGHTPTNTTPAEPVAKEWSTPAKYTGFAAAPAPSAGRFTSTSSSGRSM
jgi:hypothetical protein